VIVKAAEVPWHTLSVVRFWDLAATEPSKKNPDPDWTAGCLLGFASGLGEWFVLDVRRTRETPAKVKRFLFRTHLFDDEWLRRHVPIRVEKEGGSSGKFAEDDMRRTLFAGMDFQTRTPVGSKIERAIPFSVAAENRFVHLVHTGNWDIEAYLDELEGFPDGAHDDQVDASSGAMKELRPYADLGDVEPEAVVDGVSVKASELYKQDAVDVDEVGWADF
jgi:predicted phage terminase large subunit-like protein